jgi:RimJ/RimL family protein N-acetyltransferase
MSEPEVHIEVRRLNADDAQAFSDLRREVTADNPVPMGLSIEEELTRTLDGFKAQLSLPFPNAMLGGFLAGELAATAAVSRVGQFASSHHKMSMWGVFTSPRFRRRGLSMTVVQSALLHAFDNGARRVNLQVYVPNQPALALYRKIGFREYGTEAEAVCLEGVYYDGIHMTLVNSGHNTNLQRAASDVR